MKKPFRNFLIGGVIFILTSVNITYAALFFFPERIFPYKAALHGLVIRSDKPFDEREMEQVLSIAIDKLQSSPFYDPETHHTACICNSEWRRKVYFSIQPQAGGLHYYFTPFVFLNGPNIAKNQMFDLINEVEEDYPNLHYFVIHEMTHSMVENTIGVFHFHRLSDWVKEGYADYVGRGSALAVMGNSQAFLANAPEMNFPEKAPYLRYNLLVAYYLEQEGWSLEQLHRAKLSRREAEIFVSNALRKQNFEMLSKSEE